MRLHLIVHFPITKTKGKTTLLQLKSQIIASKTKQMRDLHSIEKPEKFQELGIHFIHPW